MSQFALQLASITQLAPITQIAPQIAPLSQLINFLVLAFSTLFPLINPIGSAIIFLGVIGPLPPATVRSLARRISLATVAFLVIIDLAGAGILKLFGVSLPVVQFSGGLVVAAMGWSLLNQKDSTTPAESKDIPPEVLAQKFERKIFYPLTFPITAGPGTLVLMLTLSAHASKGGVSDILFAQLGLFAGILLICLTVYLCYAYAPALTARIPVGTSHGIMRVTAFIVICIGVQIAWNGFISLNAVHPLLH